MKAAFIFAVASIIGQSTVEAFGAASTSNVRSMNKMNGNVDMKIFDWKARQEFENYKVPDGKALASITVKIIQHEIS
jgi:hypothetical protein